MSEENQMSLGVYRWEMEPQAAGGFSQGHTGVLAGLRARGDSHDL